MRSDHSPAPLGYLQHILLDGAKPFRYRSGVRSLLGMPDGEEGNLAFSPVLSPVGFSYTKPLFMSEPLSAQYSYNKTGGSDWHNESEKGRESIQTIVPEDISHQKSSLAGMMRNVRARMAQENDARQHKATIRDTTQQHDAAPEVKQETAKRTGQNEAISRVERAEAATQSGKTSTAQTRIEIPGSSTRRQSFPALSRAKPDDSCSQPTGEQSRLENSPMRSRQNLFKPSSPGMEDSMAPVYRSNREVANRIEQLRHTVHQLAAKVSAPSTGMGETTKAQQLALPPSPPPQPVVIIRQSSNQGRTPRAFWERSYLSRVRFRALR